MKNIVGLLVMTLMTGAFAASTTAKRNLPISKAEAQVKKDQAKAKAEEDCDEKAKKPIEIKAETISLSGTTGCSLDEVKPY